MNKTSKNLVSVIIPAYNAEKFIGETIKSALSQSYPKLEIIVVNDGSTDGTLDALRRFNITKSRIKIVSQPRAGVSAARNTGIRHSHGDLIAPLDADDIWYPEKISRQVKLMMEQDETTGLVYTWNVKIDQQSRLIGLGSTGIYEGYVLGELLMKNFIGCASVPLIRRSCFDQVGGYASEFYARNAQGCEDLDLHLRIAEKFKFAVVPQLLVAYRRCDTCMSMSHLHMFKSFELALDRLHRRHPFAPKRYLNLSYGFKMLDLEETSRQSSNYLSSLYYLWMTLIRCPHILCTSFLRRRYLSRLWSLFKEFPQKRHRSNKLNGPPTHYTLLELMEKADMRLGSPREDPVATMKKYIQTHISDDHFLKLLKIIAPKHPIE